MSSNNFKNMDGKQLLDHLKGKLDIVTEIGRAGEPLNADEWLAYLQCKKTGTFLHVLTIARAAASIGKQLDEGGLDFSTVSILKELDKRDVNELNDRLHEAIRVPDMLNNMIMHHRMAQAAHRMNNFEVAIKWVHGVDSIDSRDRLRLDRISGLCYTYFLGAGQMDTFMELGFYPHMNQWQYYSDDLGVDRVCFNKSKNFEGIVHMADFESDDMVISQKQFICHGTVISNKHNLLGTAIGEDCPLAGHDQNAKWWSKHCLPLCENCNFESSEFDICSTELSDKRIGAEFKPVSIDDYLSTIGEEPDLKPLAPTRTRSGEYKSYTRDSVDRLTDALMFKNDRHSRMLSNIAEEVKVVNPMDYMIDRSTVGTDPFGDSKAISRITREDDEMTAIRDEMTELKKFVRNLSFSGKAESTIVPGDSVTMIGEQEHASRVSRNGFIRSVEKHKKNDFEDKMIQGHMLSEEEAELAEKKMNNLQVVCGLEPTFIDKRLDFLWYMHGPLEKYFSEVNDGKLKYPSRQPIQCFKSMLRAKDDSPQTNLLRQVAISTFDFEQGIVLNNLFDLPNIHPGMTITQTNIFIMLDQLQREYELKWHSVLNGGTMPGFANKFNERAKQRTVRTNSSLGSSSRRSSESSMKSGSIVGSIVSYASGKTNQSFTR